MTKIFAPALVAGLLLSGVVSTAIAQEKIPTAWNPATSAGLQKLLDDAVQKTFAQFPELKKDELASTLIELRDPKKPVQASYRGDALIYPASVIKLFYLAAAHRWMEDKKIADTAELRKNMREMIVDSSNVATHYIIDDITGTTSGPELSENEIKVWWEKRNAVTQYFTTLGYTNINASKKPWDEVPTEGREVQAVKLFEPKRNWLNTDSTARLMSEIVTGQAVTPDRCKQMMELLHRDPFDQAHPNSQAKDFTGLAVTPGTKLWSKAGWTTETRHDCAYLELTNGAHFVLVTFTVNHANEHQIIPTLARVAIAGMEK